MGERGLWRAEISLVSVAFLFLGSLVQSFGGDPTQPVSIKSSHGKCERASTFCIPHRYEQLLPLTEIVTSSQKLIFDCLNMCSGWQLHCCFEFFPFACGHASEGQIEGHLGIFVESGFSGGGTGIVSTARKFRYTLHTALPYGFLPKGELGTAESSLYHMTTEHVKWD